MSVAFSPWKRHSQDTPELLSECPPQHLDPSLLPRLGSAGFESRFLSHLSLNIPGQETFNTTGVVMTRNGSLVSASFDGTVTISVTALSNILHASCSLPEEYRNSTEGLLGEKQTRLCL